MITADKRCPRATDVDYPAILPRATCRRRSFAEMRREQRRDRIRTTAPTVPMPRAMQVAIAREVAARGWLEWELEAIVGELPDSVRAWFNRQTTS